MLSVAAKPLSVAAEAAASPDGSPRARTASVPLKTIVSLAAIVPVTVSVLPASISTVPVPVRLATVMLLGSSTIRLLFTSVAPPVRVALSSVRVPELVTVWPAASWLAPVRCQDAPVSIVICWKCRYLEPTLEIVPALAADASSSVLEIVPASVLPPSTVPVKTAPGSMVSRLVCPAANLTE